MNRRTFLKAVPAVGVLGLAKSAFSQAAENKTRLYPAAGPDDVIKLNPPDLDKGISLMQALKKRKTTRDMSDKKLTLQQLSDLLWAADGVNRSDGKRTSPAARGKYYVNIYVVLPEAVYLYDVPNNLLKPVAKGDFRKAAGKQDFVFTTPVNLVYVCEPKKEENPPRNIPKETHAVWADVEAGCMIQNVYLYCASQGLATVVRGMLDQKQFGKVIKVKPEQVIIAQTVGYPS